MKSKKLNPVVVSGMVGMMSLVFLFYVWGKVDLVRVGYELDVLSNKKAGLQREHDQLQLDLSRLTAPNRIAFEAGEKLGLTAPKPEQVVLVSVQGPDTPNRGEPGQEQFLTIAQNLPERP
ncbi:MAG: cell division protein FtsL [Nitrospirota bacterium]|nr:cell division protein FtsL [Nitrospirota bacterium]